MVPANITASINTIPMLNGSNFKSWKENLEIVLGVINFDLALWEDSPPTLTDKTSEQKREKERWEKSNQNAQFFEDLGLWGDKVKDIIERNMYGPLTLFRISFLTVLMMILSIFIKPWNVLTLKSGFDAINEEIKSMKDNDVWELVQLPQGVKPIG
ncbi:hypothetical protein Sango_2919000 [Sesamum angolense]|uniref:Uncharacterized protein n=1 Tax=Sesamum angolense TaxID=2727404 RepID=A0AAE1T5F8_9LAMI|nr:hypothetical protein Sango_2919000 [Sesamum angolense]